MRRPRFLPSVFCRSLSVRRCFLCCLPPSVFCRSLSVRRRFFVFCCVCFPLFSRPARNKKEEEELQAPAAAPTEMPARNKKAGKELPRVLPPDAEGYPAL